MTSKVVRRDFVKAMTAATGVVIAAEQLLPTTIHAQTSSANNEMLYRPLGRTGERVSVLE